MSNIKLRHENEFGWYGLWNFNRRKQVEYKYSIYETLSLFLGSIALLLEIIVGIKINGIHYASIDDMREADYEFILFFMFSGFAFAICGFIMNLIDIKNTEVKHTFFLLSLILNILVLMEALIFIIIV